MITSKLRKILIIVAIGLAVLAVAFVAYSRLATAAPEQQALDALVTDGVVEVQTGEWYVYAPATTTPQTGLVFYPGGYVDPRAYAPAARDIAAAGYLVVVPTMPLNLAIFGVNEAAGIIEAFPEIEQWAVGGHSLGGAMAAQFAADHLATVDGLVLWAAYPGQNVDLSSAALQVVSIYGTRDGVAEIETIEASQERLPAITEWVIIEGGNHAQFGWYGEQSGDLEPEIDHLEQQRLTVAATVGLLEAVAQNPS